MREVLRRRALQAAMALALVWAAAVPGTARASSAADPGGDVDRTAVCIALAVYFEARGEPEIGQRAVAAVVMNRARDRRWPDDPCEVVWQRNERGCQFSWVCIRRSHEPQDMRAWARAMAIGEAAVRGRLRDPTGGAVFFHADSVDPYWSASFRMVVQYGAHRFYR
jgi:spore germination cell wall hydrolase CwlJ-like protein